MQRSRMALKAGVPYTSDARRMVWATASARERVGGAHQAGERQGVPRKRLAFAFMAHHMHGQECGHRQPASPAGARGAPKAQQLCSHQPASPPLPPTGVRVGEAVGVHGAHLEASHTLLHGVNQAAGGGHQGHGAVLQRGGRSGAGGEGARKWLALGLQRVQHRQCCWLCGLCRQLTAAEMHGECRGQPNGAAGTPAWRAAG